MLGETLGLLTRFCSVSSESVIGNCMDRSSPGQAMELPDHNGLGYPGHPSVSEHHRPRTLQRHHTIQNSDDAYVCWLLLLLRSGILAVQALDTELRSVEWYLFSSSSTQHLWALGSMSLYHLNGPALNSRRTSVELKPHSLA